MVTSIVLIALIGTLHFHSVISAAINYEPIKITVNENFNAQPGQVYPELKVLGPGIFHQGANFYFKPQLNLPQSYISPNIESLIPLIQQDHHPCAEGTSKVLVEKDKLIEILKPCMHPLLDISKETLSKIVLEKENNLEIVKPIIITEEPKPVTPELLVIFEEPELLPTSFNSGIPSVVEEKVKKEESIILEEPVGVFSKIPELAVRPITEPIINYIEPKPITPGLVVIPEAPVLPPPSLNNIHIVEEEVKIEEPIVVDIEPNPAIQELVAITEAPVLHSVSLHDISSIVEEEVKKEESVILKESTDVFPTIPEVAVGLVTEQIINDYVEPKPVTSELVVIPEAPPLSYNGIPPIVEEEVKKEESVILEEPTGMFTTIPEIAVSPITELIINYAEPKPITSELVFIPEAPVLPPLSANVNHVVEEELKIEEPIIVDVEPKPFTLELVVIPEAPFLPPLSYNSISPVVEEVKIEESTKVEESTGVFPSIPETTARPFSEPLETAETFALENNIFPVATEEVKIEIPILLEESIEVFPPITEISSGLTLQEFSPEITDSYVIKEVSQPNSERVVTFSETLPPTIISKPTNHLGIFTSSSNRAPKIKNLVIPKPLSLESLLLKHPFRLPVTAFPKLNLNAIQSSIWGNKNQFVYPTSYAHDIVEKRIAPNMAFRKQNVPIRVKNVYPF